ncbi:MAG: hypothetical protein ACP5PZ_11660 [Bacteroidales bacterium]
MKKLISAIFLLVSLAFMQDKPIDKDCKCKGIPLYGRVRVVNAFADFRVRVVKAFPDLRVKVVDALPQTCGQWQIVEHSPDFTIQFVDIDPDFTIQFVDAFPGIK